MPKFNKYCKKSGAEASYYSEQSFNRCCYYHHNTMDNCEYYGSLITKSLYSKHCYRLNRNGIFLYRKLAYSLL